MKKMYFWANLTLLISAIGVLTSYPFRSSLIGGLLTAGFTASLIGGLADWFAINSLFRKPFGIRPGRFFRTNIILENREKIINSLAVMVQEELLPKEVVVNKLLSHFSFQEFIRLLTSGPSKNNFEYAIESLSCAYLTKIENKEIKDIFKPIFDSENVLTSFPKRTLDIFSKNGLEKDLAQFALSVGRLLINQETLHLILTRILDEAYDQYESTNTLRKYLRPFLPHPSVLAQQMLEHGKDYLENPTTVKEIEQLIRHSLQNLATEDRVNLSSSFVFELLTELLTSKLQSDISSKLWALMHSSLSHDRFLAIIDKHLKNHLGQWFASNHSKLATLISESLKNISDQTLIDLIESKVGRELQMIRINGAIVGGIVGILFYLFNNLLFQWAVMNP